ncbi:MAG TPA: hypothetical protein VNH11_29285 [Pirellulales bacterium]|nr:hypothetical protein [Pirellulales bacterium]
MDDTRVGEHNHQTLSSGIEVNVIRYPGTTKWRFYSFDATWGATEQGSLTTKTWFAEPNGFGNHEFDSPQAYLPQVIPAISGSFQGRASLAVGIGREAE